jgi:uncharacterized protein (DUF983 family)
MSEKVISSFEAVVQCKCPRCRKGDVFSGRAYSFKAQKMNLNCPHCNLKFEREPGYFYVAMFVSYAMNVAEIITLAVASYVLGLELNFENLWYFVGIILAGVFIMAPLNYRYSRMILLHWLTPGLSYIPEAD